MAQKLYGEVTPDMDDFGKIRERIKALLQSWGWPGFNANQSGTEIAMSLESAGVTDDQLLAAEAAQFSTIVRNAYGEPDREVTETLKEAYGKA